VRRTRFTPSSVKRSTSRLVSSNDRRSSRGSQTYSSSGMQYWQRRLHRSVTDTRRLPSGLLKMSVMGCCSVTYSVSIPLLSVSSWHEKPPRGGLVPFQLFTPRW
jgi:hypothetical protein